MDYQEFEQHVAGYVEGTLDEDTRRLMDAARGSDPACEQLVRLHEQILAAFEDTPEVQAPAGLAQRIIATAELREKLMAAEQKAFRRGIWMGVVGAALGTVTLAVLMVMLNLRTEAAALQAATSVGGNWLTQAAAALYAWMDAAAVWMSGSVTIPLIGRQAPVYLLFVGGTITAVLAIFREEILGSIQS